jgi:hypothetical protein
MLPRAGECACQAQVANRTGARSNPVRHLRGEKKAVVAMQLGVDNRVHHAQDSIHERGGTYRRALDGIAVPLGFQQRPKFRERHDAFAPEAVLITRHPRAGLEHRGQPVFRPHFAEVGHRIRRCWRVPPSPPYHRPSIRGPGGSECWHSMKVAIRRVPLYQWMMLSDHWMPNLFYW